MRKVDILVTNTQCAYAHNADRDKLKLLKCKNLMRNQNQSREKAMSRVSHATITAIKQVMTATFNCDGYAI